MGAVDDSGNPITVTQAPPPPGATDHGYVVNEIDLGTTVRLIYEDGYQETVPKTYQPPGGSAGPQPEYKQDYTGQWWVLSNGQWSKMEGGPGVEPKAEDKPTSHVVNLPGGGADLVTIDSAGNVINRVNLVPDGPEAAEIQTVNGVLYQKDKVTGEWKAVAGLDVITAEREARAAENAGNRADAAAARAQSASLAAAQIAANAAENAANRKFTANENAANRTFQAGEAQKQRDFQAALTDKEMVEQSRQFGATYGLQKADALERTNQRKLNAAGEFAKNVSNVDPAALPAFLAGAGEQFKGNETFGNAIAGGRNAISDAALFGPAQQLGIARAPGPDIPDFVPYAGAPPPTGPTAPGPTAPAAPRAPRESPTRSWAQAAAKVPTPQSYAPPPPMATSPDAYVDPRSVQQTPTPQQQYNPYGIPMMAEGGFTRAPQFIAGDRVRGQPGGTAEMVTNPTRAPMRVRPLNPMGQRAAYAASQGAQASAMGQSRGAAFTGSPYGQRGVSQPWTPPIPGAGNAGGVMPGGGPLQGVNFGASPAAETPWGNFGFTPPAAAETPWVVPTNRGETGAVVGGGVAAADPYAAATPMWNANAPSMWGAPQAAAMGDRAIPRFAWGTGRTEAQIVAGLGTQQTTPAPVPAPMAPAPTPAPTRARAITNTYAPAAPAAAIPPPPPAPVAVPPAPPVAAATPTPPAAAPGIPPPPQDPNIGAALAGTGLGTNLEQYITPEQRALMEETRGIRTGAQYPFKGDPRFYLNAGFFNLSPTVQANYLAGLQSEYGVPSGDIGWEAQKYRVPGFRRSEARIGY